MVGVNGHDGVQQLTRTATAPDYDSAMVSGNSPFSAPHTDFKPYYSCSNFNVSTGGLEHHLAEPSGKPQQRKWGHSSELLNKETMHFLREESNGFMPELVPKPPKPPRPNNDTSEKPHTAGQSNGNTPTIKPQESNKQGDRSGMSDFLCFSHLAYMKILLNPSRP